MMRGHGRGILCVAPLRPNRQERGNGRQPIADHERHLATALVICWETASLERERRAFSPQPTIMPFRSGATDSLEREQRGASARRELQ
ncbi:hypothetical protein HRbin36_01072 [bacterium HR36]|nr:hypothetical protein HRbin36_01072 [bacterium HR36]